MRGVLVFALAWLTAGPLYAQERQEQVACEIHVIHAQKGKPHMDPKLKSMAHYLNNAFARYQSFKLINKDAFQLELQKNNSVKLPNGSELKLTFLGVEKNMLRLTMELSGLKTTVKKRDGALFFQAGRKYKNGMLVVAIRARKVVNKR
jgi:hypothetical protein